MRFPPIMLANARSPGLKTTTPLPPLTGGKAIPPPRSGLTTHFPAVAALPENPDCGIVRAARGEGFPRN